MNGNLKFYLFLAITDKKEAEVGGKIPDRKENFSNNSQSTKEMRKFNINAAQIKKFKKNHIRTAKYNA